MTNNTIFCGLALLILGGWGYFEGISKSKEEAKERTEVARKADPKAEEIAPEKVSPTALIPSAVGAVFLLIAAGVIFAPNLRKHLMHVGAVVGVLGFLGGFMPIIRAGSLDYTKPSIKTGLLMSLVCAIFVALAVKSFIDARKAREAGTPAA